MSADVPAEVPADVPAEVREAPPVAKPSLFVRAGAGIGRGALFVGSDHAREASRIPAVIEGGVLIRPHIGVSVGLFGEAGSSERGVSMTRVAGGGSFEVHYGPVFLGLGPHLSWFGATRKTNGDLLWRLGFGVHAMVGADVHLAPHVGIFTAVRVDGDALVKLGEPTAPWISATGVVGMSFE